MLWKRKVGLLAAVYLGLAFPVASSQAEGPAFPVASSQAEGLAFPVASSQAEDPASPIWKMEKEGEEEAALLQEQLLDELDLKETDAALREILGEDSLSFGGYVLSLIKGEIPLKMDSLKETVLNSIVGAFRQQRKTAVYILALAVISCAFIHFASVFEGSQVAEVTFYMMYFLMFTVLVRVYSGLSELAGDTAEKMIAFMQVLMPTYLAASVLANGTVSGTAFYEMLLVLISLLEWLLRYWIIPAADLYLICLMVNQLIGGDYLTKMSELLKNLVEWALKTVTALVVGLQAVQSLILPAVDSLKSSLLLKAGSAIPGVGGLFEGVTEVFFGSAVLIKNAVGAAGLLVLLALAVSPLIKLGFCAVLYRLIGAVLQPVADPRMTECVSGVGQGILLLFKIVASTGILFFVSLAMAVVSVRGG